MSDESAKAALEALDKIPADHRLFDLDAEYDNEIRATIRAALAAPPAAVPQGWMAELIALLIKRWRESAERYERAGSDWHMRMPADWPMELTLPVGLVREIAAAPTPIAGDE